MFADSLTVRILGDSSGLRAELDAVLAQLDLFGQKVGELAGLSQRLTANLGQVTYALGPLQSVQGMLDGVGQRLRAISQTPLTINVKPAIAALAQLAAAIEAAAIGMRGLSASTPGAGTGPGVATAGPANSLATPSASLAPAPFLAPGEGARKGRAAVDAMLAPTGPLSLDPRSVEPLHGWPGEMREPASNSRYGSALAAAPTVESTTNHFGGLTIQVREAVDVNNLVRDLRLQGIHLRNRRG